MVIGDPRFRKINEGFICAVCVRDVPAASSTCRDHCPHCLWSRHVDELPGDRAAQCGGLLKPVGYEWSGKKGWVILYRCEACGATKKNRFLESDAVLADSMEALRALTPEGP